MAAGQDVGVLVARLVADTQSLQRDMARAQKTLASNTSKMNRSLARVDKGMGALVRQARMLRNGVIATAIVMAGRFVLSQVQAAAAIYDTARALGFQSESLQILRARAAQYRISQQTIDMGLQRFSRRVGEAVQGQGELAGTLIQYGIAVTDAEGRTRSNEAVLRDFADALDNAKSDQERLRIAMKAFDSEAARPMIQVLTDGSRGLDEFTKRARDLGIVIDESLVERAAAASSEFNLLATTIRANTMEAVLELREAFNDTLRIGMAVLQAANMASTVARRRREQNEQARTGFVGPPVPPGIGGGGGGAAQGPPDSIFGAGTLGGGTAQGGQLPPGAPGGDGQKLSEILVQPYLEAAERRIEISRMVQEQLKSIDSEYLKSAKRRAEERLKFEQFATQAILMGRQVAADSAIGFLQVVGQRHKGAAIAALAIQKALAIKEVLIQSKVAAMRALAELGPVAGAPVAKGILLAGKISAGFIAATGLAEALRISKGNGGPGLTSATPLYTQSAGSSSSSLSQTGQTALAAAQGVNVTQVYLNGPIYSVVDFERAVSTALRNETGRDVVIIRNGSAQARELRRAYS